jgi:hypothetical protein
MPRAASLHAPKDHSGPSRGSQFSLTGSRSSPRRTIIATAASIFAAGGLITAARAEGVKCGGTNACKGQSACKGATNACKGQNECKGQGFTETSSAQACTSQGGKVL